MNEKKIIPISNNPYDKSVYGKLEKIADIKIADSGMNKLMESNPGKLQYQIISGMASDVEADMICGFSYRKNENGEYEYSASLYREPTESMLKRLLNLAINFYNALLHK